MKNEKDFFSPRANILIHLGEKLIKDEVIALIELVKNSYDADAKNVQINVSIKNKTIEILDNGHGMSKETIEKYWLEPGNSEKEDNVKNNRKSEKYKRLPIGEKGIGRFGVHKLGSSLKIVSKAKGKPEASMEIDWKLFSKAKYLKDIKIEIKEEKSNRETFFKNNTGTKIVISDLKFKISKEFVKKVSLALNSLESPYKKVDNFETELIVDKLDWQDDSKKENPLEKALYYFSAKVKNGKIVDYTYKFMPPESLRVKPRKLTLKDPKVRDAFKQIVDDEEKGVAVHLENFHIGEFTIEGHIFDLDRKLLKPLEVDAKSMSDFLKNYGGMRVYRDSMRVYNYGEQGDDWLNLDSKRVNNPTKGLSNNILVAAVNLKRAESTDLIEKTNREGFVEDEAFIQFKKAILFILNLTQTYRAVDKSNTKLSTSEKSEPVLGSIGILKDTIERKVSSKEVREDLLKQVRGLEKEYSNIKTILIKSSNAGLSLSTAIHEMEKVILEANHLVDKGKYDIKIKSIVIRLKELLDNYSKIIKSSSKKNFDLIEAIEQAIFNTEYRFQAHNVKLVRNYKKSQKINIKGQQNLIIGSLINLFDNSFYWLKREQQASGGKFNSEITISVTVDKKYAKVSVSDNGLGFLISGEDAIKPFITAREGMGLGLNIIYEVMQTLGGELEIIESNNIKETPYSKGATVVLVLQRT